MPGETVELGPLARTDLCACIKGLLDNLGTVSPNVVWRGLLPPWGVALFAWEVAFPLWKAWETLSLAECLLPLENDLPELLSAWVILLVTKRKATASWELALLVV